MDDPITLKFTYTPAEYAAAYRFFCRKKFWGIRDFLIALTVLILGLLLQLKFENSLGFVFIMMGIFFIVLVPLLTWTLPFIFFRQEPQLREEYRLEFSAEGIHFTTTHINSRLQWSLFKEVLEDKRFFLLLYGKRSFTIIPKRAFPSLEQEKQFRHWIAKSIPGPA